MKNYPFWPARIAKPPVVNQKADEGLPKEKPSACRKNQHYVIFFGTKTFAWISDENIVPHSEEMLNKVTKKKSASLIKAVKEMVKASVGNDSVESDESSESPKINFKKSGRTSKQKIKCEKMAKSAQKTDLINASDKELSPEQNAARASNDYSAPTSNTSNNIDNMISGFSDESGYEYFPPLDYPASLGEKFSETTSKKIGFIGLGAMGQKIVKHLLNSGHNVSVWNRTSEKCKDFVTAGAQQFSTPAEVVWNCDIIFCCVSGPEAAKSIVFGNCGILHGLEKSEPGSKGYIELTSMNPVTLLEIYAAIADKGGKYLEAPISDSLSLVEKGLPLIPVAGDRQFLIDCVSCFHAFAERICFMSSEVGAASKMNIALSSLRGPMNCPLFLQKYQAMVQNNFTADISLKYQQKDLEIATQLSNAYQQPCPMMSTAHELYKTATRRGYSECDVSALYLANLKVD
ncbi:putative oxidoreductase GLYR1 homolog [Trichonephila clavata]|nr:putative oxidoreductase GLYR1 homolog [Trichonephila clavata]